MKFVSWDDDIPNIYIYGKNNVPNHQPGKNVEPDPVSVLQFLDLLKGTIENFAPIPSRFQWMTRKSRIILAIYVKKSEFSHNRKNSVYSVPI